MNDLLIALAIFAAGFGAAWSWQGARGAAEIGALTTRHEKDAGTAARAATAKLKAANDRADAIDKAAAARDAEQTSKLQEVQRELKTATRNRPCLGGAALRVLGKSPGLRLAPAEPAPAGALHGGSAAATADSADEGDFSTDTQIADWIAVAGDRYERCRARIRDIRAWNEGER